MFGQVKVTSDGIDANGKPMHVEWSGKLDGKDYPLTGDPNSDTRSYTKVNDRTLTTANKKEWQGQSHRSDCYLSRWQNSYHHRDWDHSEREKIQDRRRLRQTISR